MTRIISIVGGLQPSTPTIGTATDGGTGTSANVAFTASSYIGKGTITYTATSSPGGFTGTSATSPISVTGLTTGTAYTFTVVGTTNYGVSSLTSGASNSVTPASPDAGVYYPINSITVPSGGAASVTFSSIPSTYTHLQIRATHLFSQADGTGWIQFNSDTSNNYSMHRIIADGSTVSGQNGSGSYPYGWCLVATPTNTNAPGGGIIDILDYTNTNKYTTVRSLSGTDSNGYGYITLNSFAWLNTNAVTQIKIYPTSGTFNQYSSFALYGIKGA